MIGDVGQGAREEIDFARGAGGLGRGADYGWPCREGTVAGAEGLHGRRRPTSPPVFDYAQRGRLHAR